MKSRLSLPLALRRRGADRRMRRAAKPTTPGRAATGGGDSTGSAGTTGGAGTSGGAGTTGNAGTAVDGDGLGGDDRHRRARRHHRQRRARPAPRAPRAARARPAPRDAAAPPAAPAPRARRARPAPRGAAAPPARRRGTTGTAGRGGTTGTRGHDRRRAGAAAPPAARAPAARPARAVRPAPAICNFASGLNIAWVSFANDVPNPNIGDVQHDLQEHARRGRPRDPLVVPHQRHEDARLRQQRHGGEAAAVAHRRREGDPVGGEQQRRQRQHQPVVVRHAAGERGHTTYVPEPGAARERHEPAGVHRQLPHAAGERAQGDAGPLLVRDLQRAGRDGTEGLGDAQDDAGGDPEDGQLVRGRDSHRRSRRRA